jgi:hypothetical protein
MTKRINARIDDEMARKIRALQSRTGKSTTEILRDSIDAYYGSVSGKGGPGVALTALVGCADGPSDLAGDYKRYLGESLGRKSARERAK